MNRDHLPEHLSDLLREVVAKREPQLLPLVEKLESATISEELRTHLRDDLVADELCKTGFDPDDSVNARGILLEELIGKLTRL